MVVFLVVFFVYFFCLFGFFFWCLRSLFTTFQVKNSFEILNWAVNILIPASSFVLHDLWYFEHKHIGQCACRGSGTMDLSWVHIPFFAA